MLCGAVCRSVGLQARAAARGPGVRREPGLEAAEQRGHTGSTAGWGDKPGGRGLTPNIDRDRVRGALSLSTDPAPTLSKGTSPGGRRGIGAATTCCCLVPPAAGSQQHTDQCEAKPKPAFQTRNKFMKHPSGPLLQRAGVCSSKRTRTITRRSGTRTSIPCKSLRWRFDLTLLPSSDL